ncbi:MAG: hypothetical protein H6822_20005 [Planctomycetaceae bacterium]|nr:hypothetical protein [Planctomycetales bacterium]MCB9924473.1 hypothetical protein [Planctomycetaceae bacterium]
MQFRKGGQGDERRRRVFRDEMLAASNEDGAASSESLKTGDDVDGRTYSDAAAAQRQPSLTSLLPQRSLTLVALFVLGGIAITGIELLYTKFFIGLPDQFRDSLAVLDVASRGSVAHWFASLTLFTGAIASQLVYLIRRHRLDDYRGRYRVWHWATVCFLLASFDAATGAHAILQPAMIELTGKTLLGDGTIWVAIVLGCVIATCLVRLAIEVSGSRLATSFLSLAAGSYVAFLVVSFHPALSTAELTRVVAESATLLAGHFVLVYSVALYGRHVYQEAQGTRRATRKKPVVSKPSEPKPETAAPRKRARLFGSKNVRIDSAHEKTSGESKTVEAPTISKKSIQKTVATNVNDQPEESDRSMSKAERRRLRKLERRQQRQGSESDE